MTRTQHLRSVAASERHDGNLLEVSGLEFGVRFDYGYIAGAFRLWVVQEPDEELLEHLYRAGWASRDPNYGHGYVQIGNWGISVPQTDWATRDRGELADDWNEEFQFSVRLRRKVRRWLQEQHLRHLHREFQDALWAAWNNGVSTERIVAHLGDHAPKCVPDPKGFVEGILDNPVRAPVVL